jgi:septal ring factor EnvC (AmiA/AmiB activator)
MMSFGLVTDFVLVALLVATLFYVGRLLRRLGHLQKDRDTFQKLIQDFSTATAQADKSLADLRVAADGIGKELGSRIERGQSVVSELQRSSDDLKMLIARAESAADKLEVRLDATRQSAQAQAHAQNQGQNQGQAPTIGAQPHGESESRVAQDAQTQALLSALGRIR